MDVRHTAALRSPTPASRTALRGVGTPGEPSHLVQFYRDDDFLCTAIADFLAEGIIAGQPIAVIATESHRRVIAKCLAAKGLDVESGQYGRGGLWLDARELLVTFMVHAVPDRERFHASIGMLIERARRSNPHAIVRAYGEMVDLLWKDGNITGAVQLEALWNELARTQRFTLLCAYAMENFREESHAVGFTDICRHHAHVIPTEDYTSARRRDTAKHS